MDTILEQLASAQGRRDEVPNQELAALLVETENIEAVEVLVTNLGHKTKAVQNDCIKVLYEIGEQRPDLLVAYSSNFLNLLQHKNNRLQWGAMTALKCIAKVDQELIYKELPVILKASDSGSVITKDNAMVILIILMANDNYRNSVYPLLKEQLLKSPVNQFPMYAERVLPVINANLKKDFIDLLSSRLEEIEKESKRKRVEKVIKKLIK